MQNVITHINKNEYCWASHVAVTCSTRRVEHVIHYFILYVL